MRVKGTEKSGLDQSQDERELSLLMRSSQAGDAESYRRLLVRVRTMLQKYVENSFARFGLGSRGGQEDVLQDILLAIHLKRHTFDPEQFFLPWLYAVARYKLIDHLRKNKVSLRSTVSIDDELENVETLMPLEVGVDLDIETLFESLPEKQKVVLKLVKIEGLSVDEASKRTGFSQSDIKVTVHRAIKSLQNSVKGDHHEN
jgi:RNA polymerase sigma-70 factor (ECF subfamily)